MYNNLILMGLTFLNMKILVLKPGKSMYISLIRLIYIHRISSAFSGKYPLAVHSHLLKLLDFQSDEAHVHWYLWLVEG